MRLLFVSHSFAPEEAPLTNVGGMQRVAMELFEHLEADPAVETHALVLHYWTFYPIACGELPYILNSFPPVTGYCIIIPKKFACGLPARSARAQIVQIVSDSAR